MSRRLPEYQSSVSLRRGDRGAVNIMLPSTSALEGFSELAQSVSEAGIKIAKQRDTAQMMREMSDIKLASSERLEQLSQEGTGDKNFAEFAVNEFTETANEFIARQPAYLRDTARQKMLGLKDDVATSALRIQAALAAQQLTLDMEQFSNNMANEVQLGMASEADALAQVKEFVEGSVPANDQNKALADLSGIVKSASLMKMARENPHAALRAAKSGDYNDVNANTVKSIIDMAEHEIKSAEAARIKAINATAKLRGKDNASFAINFAELNNREINSLDDVIDLQLENDIPMSDVSLVTKEKAQNEVYRRGDDLKTVEGISRFVGDIYNEYDNPKHAQIALNDYVKHGGMDENVRVLFHLERTVRREGRDHNTRELQFTEVFSQVMSSGFTAVDNEFKAQNGNDDRNLGKFNSHINSTFNSSFEAVKLNADQRQTFRDQKTAAYQQARLLGKSHKEAQSIALYDFENGKWHDNNKLWLPDDIDITRIRFSGGGFASSSVAASSNAMMRSRGINAVQKETLGLTGTALKSISPENYPVPIRFENDFERYKESLFRDGYWVNGLGLTETGEQYIIFMHDSAPVKRVVGNSVEDIIVTHDDLRLLYGAE